MNLVKVNKINTFTLYMFGVKIVHELLVIIFVTWKRRNHFLKYQIILEMHSTFLHAT